MKYRPWLGHAFVVAGLAVMLWLAIAQVTGSVVDLDLWHELALAREVVRLGYVPQRDLFAFTPTVYHSVNHEWGAGMIAYGVLSVAGGAGIVLLNALLGAAVLVLALEHSRQRGAKPAMVAMAALPALLLLGRGFLPVRAQAYSYVFFAALLLMLCRDRSGSRRWIALWLPVFLLWVNIHASFVLAFAVIVLCAADALLSRRPSAHLWSLLPAMAALVCVNPFGREMYGHLLRTLTMARPLIDEWRPVWQADDAAGLIKVLATSLPIFGYAVVRAKPGLFGPAVMLACASAGILHTKMLPYYAVAWLAFMPAWLSETPIGAAAVDTVMGRRRTSQAIWGIAVAAALGGIFFVRAWEPRVPDSGEKINYPVGAVRYLRAAHFEGNLVTRFNEGAYVIWKLYPDVKVSMDSRYDVAYPESLVYVSERAFSNEHDWRAFVTRYHGDGMIISRSLPLERELTGSGAWPRVYRDRNFSVFARSALALPIVDIPDRSFSGTLP